MKKLKSRDISLHEVPCGHNNIFPVIIDLQKYDKPGSVFKEHWHEHIEFLYVQSGQGVFECNHVPYNVKSGDLILVNSSELHCGYSISNEIAYYCIIVDPAFMQSSLLSVSDVKYFTHITQNLILFNNRIEGDSELIECIRMITVEFEKREIGYELSVKAYLDRILVLLIRRHLQAMLSPMDNISRKNEIERLSSVFTHIEDNYQEEISGRELARMASISLYHFSRLFKKVTSMTITQYVNSVRIRHAAEILCDSDMNITETALAAGFNDANYFTRIFKKYMGVSPTTFKSQAKECDAG